MKHSLLALASLALVACSGAASPATTPDDDAGDPSASSTPSNGDGVGAVGNGPGTPDDASAGAPVASGDEGGASAPPPANPDASSPPSAGGVFADAGAYVATVGPSARNQRHTGSPNPAGQACLSCHGGQKPNVARFLFAGTVWTDATGATPTPKAEVRAVGADGAGLSAYTDADGNFFYAAAGATLAAPAHGGARDATSVALMSNVFNDGDCNACHKGGGQG